LDCPCPESADKYRQPLDIQRKIDRLIKEAASGDIKEVESILQSGIDCNARNRSCRTALMEAAGKGHFDLVALLLSNGALVHLKDKDGETALFKASVIKNEDVIKLLKAYGAKE
jgi:ankyrin repeat protein